MQRGKNQPKRSQDPLLQRSSSRPCCGYPWIWYRYLLVISLIRFSDINICVCVGDADALLLLRILCSFFLFFFLLLPIQLSRRNLRSLLYSGNRRDRIRTSTQLADGLYSRSIIFHSWCHKITAFRNYAKHCSDVVCTLLLALLHPASAVTAVACLGPADTWEK